MNTALIAILMCCTLILLPVSEADPVESVTAQETPDESDDCLYVDNSQVPPRVYEAPC